MMDTARLKKVLLALGIAANVGCLCYYALRSPPRSARGAVPPARFAPSTAEPKLVSNYSSQFDQTDVYTAEDLVLVDDPGRRLLLSPIYTAKGAGGAAPVVVNFRFYSFSGTPLYHGGEALRLTADGWQFWASRDALYSYNEMENGEVVEHLGGGVPFELFAAAVRGDDVRVTVGREEIRLSWGQLQALRRMARCAVDGPCS